MRAKIFSHQFSRKPNFFFLRWANKVRRFAYTLGLSVLLLFIGYLSNNCKSPSSPEIPDSGPTAILSVSPESGGAPLEVNINLGGSGDIVKYTLKISDNSSGFSEYRINESVGIDRAFRRIEKTREEHRRKGIQRSSKTREKIRSQRGYDVGMQFREIEELKVRDSGVEDYAEVPEVPEIGFEGISPALENVEPYKMVVLGEGFNGVDETIESNSPIDITRTYDNVTNQDIKIFFTGEVTASDGRVSNPVSKNVIVSPRGDIYISGTLKSNETDSVVRGMLKIFDSNRNLLETNNSDDEGYVLTNSSGKFNFQVKRIASELDEITIKAAHGTPGNLQSWVRTISVPAISQSGISIAVVPYGEFKSNPNEFRNFMYEVTHDTGNLRMFDYEGFDRGFIIIKENLNDSLDNGKPKGEGKFTNEQVQYIKNIITPGVEKVEKILNTRNYTIKIQADSKNYNPGAGVIFIIPSTTSPGGSFVPYGIEALIQGGDIYIKDSITPDSWGLKKVTLHEIGHILYEHPTNQNSVMTSPGTYYYSSLDLKGTYICYEKTYLRENPGEGESYLPIQHLKYILGMSFDKWN